MERSAARMDTAYEPGTTNSLPSPTDGLSPLEEILDKLWQQAVRFDDKEMRNLSGRGRSLRIKLGKPISRTMWAGYDPDHYLFLLAIIFMPGTEPRRRFGDLLLDKMADDLDTIRNALAACGVGSGETKLIVGQYVQYLEVFQVNGRWPYRFRTMLRYEVEAEREAKARSAARALAQKEEAAFRASGPVDYDD